MSNHSELDHFARFLSYCSVAAYKSEIRVWLNIEGEICVYCTRPCQYLHICKGKKLLQELEPGKYRFNIWLNDRLMTNPEVVWSPELGRLILNPDYDPNKK